MRKIPIMIAVIVMSSILAACSAPWDAPVESRSGYNPSGGRIEGPTYRVRSGDTLYGIAWRAGVDYQDLARWNRISAPYTIYVNQKLSVVPSSSNSAQSRAITSASQTKNKSTGTGGASKKATSTQSTAKKKTKKSSSTAKSSSLNRSSGSLRWTWPTTGKVVQTFSPSDPTRKGIKIRGTRGQNIKASEAGEVVYSGSGLVGYGQLIIIKHNKDFLSAYGHNAKRLVREGDKVTKGKVVAEMGIAAGEPQLHFEIRRRGKPVNPLSLLPRR